jgi:hypothetical protein
MEGDMNPTRELPRRWRHASAGFGAVVWIALLAVPARGEVGLGAIERLFLLAPL